MAGNVHNYYGVLRYSVCDAESSFAFMPLQPTSKGRSPEPAGAVTHWNHGPARRKPEVPAGDTRRAPDGHKRHTEIELRKRGLLNNAIDVFVISSAFTVLVHRLETDCGINEPYLGLGLRTQGGSDVRLGLAVPSRIRPQTNPLPDSAACE